MKIMYSCDFCDLAHPDPDELQRHEVICEAWSNLYGLGVKSETDILRQLVQAGVIDVVKLKTFCEDRRSQIKEAQKSKQ